MCGNYSRDESIRGRTLYEEIWYLKKPKNRDLRETIEYGPLCITDLFQNKSVAYF